MAKPPARDLFDDSTMTFGEHLETLRVHLLKSLAGLIVAVLFALAIGDQVIVFISRPINAALKEYGLQHVEQNDLAGFNFITWLKQKSGMEPTPPPPVLPPPPDLTEIDVTMSSTELAKALHEANPQNYPVPAKNLKETQVTLRMRSPVFEVLQQSAERSLRPVTLNVQEAFLTYLKVALVTGLVLASPWIFYQIWLFVAAGLYPHERKYVHIYLPLSLGLFLGGAVFCFYLVFPYVLDFLLGYNVKLGIVPQIRLSEWISFALMLPVMFGLSFQLPIVMLFLEKLQIFDVRGYREKRRMAILVIAIVSMLLTPADPMSMMLMMVPLVILYEFGIWMCSLNPARTSPFGEPA